VRRAVIAALAMLVATDDAGACHRYRDWRYPRPQTCRVTALAPRVRFRFPRARINIHLVTEATPPHRIATPIPDIPLPDLVDIDWGHPPDEDTRGRLLLRVILQGKEDK
jgi:hypothetical protein